MENYFAFYRFFFSCLLALGGIVCVWFGYRLFASGAGLFKSVERFAIKNREFAVSVTGMSAGGILMLTSAVWVFGAYHSVPRLEVAAGKVIISDQPQRSKDDLHLEAQTTPLPPGSVLQKTRGLSLAGSDTRSPVTKAGAPHPVTTAGPDAENRSFFERWPAIVGGDAIAPMNSDAKRRHPLFELLTTNPESAPALRGPPALTAPPGLASAQAPASAPLVLTDAPPSLTISPTGDPRRVRTERISPNWLVPDAQGTTHLTAAVEREKLSTETSLTLHLYSLPRNFSLTKSNAGGPSLAALGGLNVYTSDDVYVGRIDELKSPTTSIELNNSWGSDLWINALHIDMKKSTSSKVVLDVTAEQLKSFSKKLESQERVEKKEKSTKHTHKKSRHKRS